MAAASAVSASQPELIAKERSGEEVAREGSGEEEAKDLEEHQGDKWPLPPTNDGPIKRFKSFLRNRASSEGHLARQGKVGKTKAIEKDVEQVLDTARK